MIKKSALFVLSIVFQLIIVTTVFSQPSFGTSNDGDGNQDLACQKCNFSFNVSIELANLNLHPPYSNTDQEYFPSNLPNMILQLSLGQEIVRVNVDTFVFSHITPTGVQLFKFETSINIDMCYVCIKNEVGEFDYDVNLNLLTGNQSSGYSNYPACMFTDEDDIFSCNYFVQAGGCEGYCNNSEMTTNQSVVTVRCNNCHINDDDGQDSPNIIGERSRLSLIDSKIFPNPFQEQIIISWDTNEFVSPKIEIHNELGQSIFRKTILNNKEGILKLETSEFDVGFFFLTISSEDNIKVHKIVKI